MRIPSVIKMKVWVDKPRQEPKIATLEPVPNTSDEDIEDPLASEASFQSWEDDGDQWLEEYDVSTPQT